MSDRDQIDVRRRHHKEDLDLFSRFQKVAVDRLDKMAQQDVSWEMGDSERELIRQLNGMGVKEGLVGGVATFVLLRRGPILLRRYLYQRKFGRQQTQMGNVPPTPPPQAPPGSSFQLSKPPPGPTSNPFQQNSLPTGAQQLHHQNEWTNPRPKSFIVRSVLFCLDVTISLLAGTSISIAYTDTERIRRQLVEMPLLEGRSLVADAFCDTLEEELAKIRQEGHPSYKRLVQQRQQDQATYGSSSASVLEVVPSVSRRYSRNSDDDSDSSESPVAPYLQDILTVIEHCQRRRHVEHEIRLQNGWDKSHPVLIPAPGIPRDGPQLPLLGNQGESSETTTWDKDSSPDFADSSSTSDGSSNDFDWTTSSTDFVTDQEEQIKKDGGKSDEPKKKKGWW